MVKLYKNVDASLPDTNNKQLQIKKQHTIKQRRETSVWFFFNCISQ